MRAAECVVDGCERRAELRGVCVRHYRQAQYRGWLDLLPPAYGPAPDVCVCEWPCPTGIGECVECRRPVVTFLSIPNARELWPTEYERAVGLGLEPVTPSAYDP